MKRRLRVLSLVVVATMVGSSTVSAQWIVHDPVSYGELVVTFNQLVREYNLLVQQARRLPLDLAARYRVPSVPWASHDVAADYAGGLLDALNRGVRAGDPYRDTLARLDAVRAVLPAVPDALRERLGTVYATIELADQLSRSAVAQTGSVRANGLEMLRTIQALEDDTVSNDDRFHTQTALLNKINGASVLGLRIAEQTTQSLSGVVEQLVVVNKRQRDAEAKAMNAQLYQWQFGRAYGEGLFTNTARNLDGWQQP
jgi:hypothetical protein